MTIAEQLKAFHTKNDCRIDYSTLVDDAEQISVLITQDWENETTEYDFIDGSVIVINGPSVWVYGSRY